MHCLEERGKVTAEPTFKQETIAKASITRENYIGNVIEKRHIEAARQLKTQTSPSN